MIEHRYPEGNQLTLRLIAAISSHEDQLQPGCVVVSIYEQSGHASTADRPYFVRGHVVMFDARQPDATERSHGIVEGRFANHGGGVATLDYAWAAARAMAEQLEAAYAAMVSLESPGGAS